MFPSSRNQSTAASQQPIQNKLFFFDVSLANVLPTINTCPCLQLHLLVLIWKRLLNITRKHGYVPTVLPLGMASTE
jgi:hypothetical protein